MAATTRTRTDYRAIGVAALATGLALMWWGVRLAVRVERDQLVAVNFARKYRWRWSDVASLDIGGTTGLTPFRLYPVMIVVAKNGTRTKVPATVLASEETIEKLWRFLSTRSDEHGFPMFSLQDWDHWSSSA